MSGSTHSKKATDTDDEANAKPLSNKKVFSLLDSLQSELSSLKSACLSDAAEMQLLHLAISPPPPTISPFSQHHVHSSAYDCFMKEPYRAANCSGHLQGNGSNFAKWVSGLNRVLCIALSSELLVNDSPSLLENCSPQENREISHFIDATLPPDFALCIGVVPSCTTAKEFFSTIKARCFPGNQFQKLKVVCNLLGMLVKNGSGQLKPNSTIILTLQKSFALFKKLGVEADEIEGLLAQAACHAPSTLDQLVTSAIMARGSKKPLSTFVGQAILNALPAANGPTQHSSPFIYRVSDLPGSSHFQSRLRSPYSPKPISTTSEVRQPPEHLVDKFGGSCFHCGCTGHWQADCPVTKGFTNPNPRPPLPAHWRTPCPATPERQPPPPASYLYQRERVLQVKLVENDAADRVLIDTGASIHLSGSLYFATTLRDISPFRIFFANSNSSKLISQTTTLKIPVKRGFVIVHDVAFSTKILGRILSVGRLCRAGVVPFFENLSLSLLVSGMLVSTTFRNDCWWMDFVPGG
ncbi:hypothetical protein O181_040937 [Austropuccinia psidii MF-1]|uniref:CCHC-type domain-containing protein n=1 Tax=Austropuccinia psidii MF-1 TaxID=1389203 RepID=A0A9Q3HED6_9BASI|nr:hypothetical protein [Austropuccinia psidii MF-1]